MADRDDHYRGYGRPSGRYYENREYDPGYDRERSERGGGSWFGGGRDDNDRDRSRERGWGGSDRDDWRDRNRGGNEDRGFFERAGEQVRSWFSDDDDDRRERGSRDRYQGGGGWQDRARSGGMMSGNRGNYDRDDRSPQTFRGEPTSGGYDHRRDEWRGSSGGYESGGSRYGATSGYGAGSSRNQFSGGRLPHDDHYSEWRQQQMNELDRDYDEYRREHRDKFHSEFSSWRGQRQQQRSSMRKVTEHMEVVGSDGQPVGTVDKVSGDRIILTKNGPMAGGHHHSIPCSWIQSVDERVTINKTAEQARDKWTDEENRRALFESDNQRHDDGPHILDRSFSGTYEGR